MDPELLASLAERLSNEKDPDFGPYLDAACEALEASGVDAVRIKYTIDALGVGCVINALEPAGSAIDDRLSGLIFWLAKAIVSSGRGRPQRKQERKVSLKNTHYGFLRIDHRRKPRVGFGDWVPKPSPFRVSAVDDPALKLHCLTLLCEGVEEITLMYNIDPARRTTVDVSLEFHARYSFPEPLLAAIKEWVRGVLRGRHEGRAIGHVRLDAAGGLAGFEHELEVWTQTGKGID